MFPEVLPFFQIIMRMPLVLHLKEAEELLQEVESWSEKELEELPKIYEEKAKEYRRLLNNGEK